MRMACGYLVPDALVQGREGRRAAEKLAAEKLLRKLIRTQSRTPCVMVTDKPGSEGAARTGMGLNVEHRQHKDLNNRAKCAFQRSWASVPRDRGRVFQSIVGSRSMSVGMCFGRRFQKVRGWARGQVFCGGR
jgi:hypothetical protein